MYTVRFTTESCGPLGARTPVRLVRVRRTQDFVVIFAVAVIVIAYSNHENQHVVVYPTYVRVRVGISYEHDAVIVVCGGGGGTVSPLSLDSSQAAIRRPAAFARPGRPGLVGAWETRRLASFRELSRLRLTVAGPVVLVVVVDSVGGGARRPNFNIRNRRGGCGGISSCSPRAPYSFLTQTYTHTHTRTIATAAFRYEYEMRERAMYGVCDTR